MGERVTQRIIGSGKPTNLKLSELLPDLSPEEEAPFEERLKRIEREERLAAAMLDSEIDRDVIGT